MKTDRKDDLDREIGCKGGGAKVGRGGRAGEAGCGQKAGYMQLGRAEPEPEPRGTRQGGSEASRNIIYKKKKNMSL